ncbi:MAG: alkaline phosphatase family protein, partial [Acidimicrobiia bacterium]
MHRPSYDGRGLVNLVAELEMRMIGSAPSPALHSEPAALLPEAETHVLVLFDGLGNHQLEHPRARPLLEARAGTVDAPFPTTTVVSL